MARKTKAEALKTRQMLIEAAILQFAQNGVAKTTLTDIADAAGVTRGAVYWHFSSKTDIFNAIWEQQAPLKEIVCYQMQDNIHPDPLIHLRNQFVTTLQYIAADSRLRALLHILYHRCEFSDDMTSEQEIRQKIGFNHEYVRQVLQECQAKGRLSSGTNINIMLIMLHGFISGVIKNWLMHPEGFDLYQNAPELVDNIMMALTAKKEAAIPKDAIAC